jgi:hypothetical protein
MKLGLILSRDWMTIDGFWIGNGIYLTRNSCLNFTEHYDTPTCVLSHGLAPIVTSCVAPLESSGGAATFSIFSGVGFSLSRQTSVAHRQSFVSSSQASIRETRESICVFISSWPVHIFSRRTSNLSLLVLISLERNPSRPPSVPSSVPAL